MAIALEAARGLVARSAKKVDDRAEDASYYSSIAKVFAADNAFKAASDTVQVI